MDAIKRARRLTLLVINSMLVVMWLMVGLVTVVELGSGLVHWMLVVPALIATIVFTWLYLRITHAVFERRYPFREVVASGALAVTAMALAGAEPFGWGFVLIAWLSVAAIGVTKRTAMLQGVGTFLVATGISAFWGASGKGFPVAEGVPPSAAIGSAAITYALICAFTPMTNRLWVWIWLLAAQAHEGQEAKARLAVAEERLRFARDLHDLVGHQLSALAVKSELAVRLADGNVAAAKGEMAEVRDLTRKALRELREAVRGYRELDLDAELKSVKSVLEAAGVRCTLLSPYRGVPRDSAPVFAYVLREAVTNVLKHSTASFCDITLRFTDEETTLEVRNDGVARKQAEDLGSGLCGLGERLAAVGGKLTALPDGDGEFVLKAVVPR